MTRRAIRVPVCRLRSNIGLTPRTDFTFLQNRFYRVIYALSEILHKLREHAKQIYPCLPWCDRRSLQIFIDVILG